MHISITIFVMWDKRFKIRLSWKVLLDQNFTIWGLHTNYRKDFKNWHAHLGDLPQLEWGNLAELQHFRHLMQKTDSLEKALMLEKIEGRVRSKQQKMRWLDDITDSMGMSLCNSRRQWRTAKAGMLQSMGSQKVRHNLVTEQLRFSSAKSFALVTKYKIKD